MSSELRVRRGTGAQHASFTGANAEITVNTTNKSLHVHDGTTAGGYELARIDLNNVDNTVFAAKAAAAGISGGAGGSASVSAATKASPVVVTTSTAHGFIDGQQVSITDVLGMTQLNGNSYYVDVLTSTTFALYSDVSLTVAVNGTAYGTYTSGGKAVGADFAGAPISGSYITINAEAGLPNERRLQAANGVVIVDGGAGGAVTVGASFSTNAPSNLGSANAGASTSVARADHVHAMPTATDVGAVPTSRQVIAGSGLIGGGALSSNVTLSLNANLHMLTDVTITGTPANGDVLMYNSATSQFENSSTFAKSTVLKDNVLVANSTISKFNFVGTGVTTTVNATDPSRIDIDLGAIVTEETVQDIVGGMVSSNTETGLTVVYDDPTGKLNFVVNNPTITLSGDVNGTATMTGLANVTITTTIAADSVALGADTTGNYVAGITGGTGITVSGSGVESATVNISVNTTEATFLEEIQDIVGAMVSGNTETGVAVTYDDTFGKLNFAVGNPTITLSGDVTGSATINNLANVTLTTTIAANSVELGTDTTGNYIATIAGSNGIVVTGSGAESAAVSLSIDPTNANFKESVEDIIGNMVDLNTENGIAVTYDDTLGKLNFDVADPVIAISGAVTGSATMVNLTNVTISTSVANNAVALGQHTTGNYVANITGGTGLTVTGSGVETANISIAVNMADATFVEAIQDLVGDMVSANTENGIVVTYDDANAKLNFDVNDPTITFSGAVVGAGTITNLANVTIATTIANDAVALGTNTTGNYVAGITAGNGITISGSGVETANVSVAVNYADAGLIEAMQDIVGGMVELNTENGIVVTYDDANAKLNFDVNDPTITIAGAVTGSQTMTNLGNTTITVAQANDSVTLGQHTVGNFVATITAGNGVVVTGSGSENAAVTIGVNTAETNFLEAIQDIVGDMVSGLNTENGIVVTYDDANAKLNFDVNDPTVTLSGAITGSNTITNLGNVIISTAIANDAVTLGQHTVGNYVAGITGGVGLTVTGSGVEGASVSIAVNPAEATFLEALQDVIGDMVSTNVENGIVVTYDDANAKLNFDVNDPTITLAGVITGSNVLTNLGNVTITTALANDSVTLGQHTVGNYVASASGANGITVTGSGEGAAVSIGLNVLHADFVEGVQDVVGGMVSSNTENGIAVTYDDTTGKLNFDVNDPLISITGAVSGSQTMTNLGAVTISVAQANDSVTLGQHTVGNYVANIVAGTGITVANAGVETANVTISVNTAEATFLEAIQDIIGDMVSIPNTENGIVVTYDDANAKLNFDVNDPTITLSGAITGSNVMTNLGSITINTALANDAVTLGTHTVGSYVATISGTGGITVANSGAETANVVIGIDPLNTDFVEAVQDVIGGMVTTNIEAGIAVTYDDTTGKLNFDVNDPVITLTGDVTGVGTIANLGSVTITTTIQPNSIDLGTDTTGNYVANIIAGTGITVANSGVETANVTISVNPTEANFVEAMQDLVGSMVDNVSLQTGITVTYNDTLGKLAFDVADPTITLAGDIVGAGTINNLGNVTISTTIQPNSVELGTDTVGNYVSTITAGIGVIVSNSGVENANVTVSLDTNGNSLPEFISDVVGGMVTSNTENGISVTYNDDTNTLDFDVADFTITLGGDLAGAITITNLLGGTLNASIQPGSVALDTDTTGNYVATVAAANGITVTGSGVSTAAVQLGLNFNHPDFIEGVQDAMIGMFSLNIENGIAVTMDDATNKINFDVNDPVITLSGAVSGTGQILNLGDVSIVCTVADNSHNHTIANIAGLQAALDAKIGGAGGSVTGTLNTQTILPTSNIAYTLGSSALRFTEVWATTHYGLSTSAQYADLAERYKADANYPIGSLVKLGGTKEITATTSENDPQVVGVISENPAFIMNDGAGNTNEWLPVAMTGRVPVKVEGPVVKGQRIVSSNTPGVGKAVDDADITSVFTVVGRALTSSDDTNIKLIECIIGKL